MCPARWRRLASPQAGWTLWYTPGPSPVPYQPTPKPSPLVVSAPSRECRLWSIRPCLLLNSSSSIRMGLPCHAIHRHIGSPLLGDAPAKRRLRRSFAHPPMRVKRDRLELEPERVRRLGQAVQVLPQRRKGVGVKRTRRAVRGAELRAQVPADE